MPEFTPAEQTQPTAQAELTRRALLTGVTLVGASMLLEGCSGGSGHPQAEVSAASHASASASPSAEASPSAASGNTHHDLANSGDESLATLGKHEKNWGASFTTLCSSCLLL